MARAYTDAWQQAVEEGQGGTESRARASRHIFVNM